MTQILFILDRATIDSATELLSTFGASAEQEAASRAAQGREAGNLLSFCRWRQIERIVAVLADDAVCGTVH